MTLHRLDNGTWGFASNCFVCEPGNDGGLRIPFVHDDAAGMVTAEFTLDDRFSGTPRYVHGGVTLSVLDEAMAWAAIALGGSFAVTRTTTATFHHPVKVGQRHRVEATLTGRNDDASLALAAVVLDAAGRRCVEAEARFVPLTAGQAGAAIGDVSGDDARFVRG